MVEVKIPAMLRTHVGGAKSVQTGPGVLRDVLAELVENHPGLGGQVLAEKGELHRFVNVYVNDEDVRYLEGLETKINEGDVVGILPAVAGGCIPIPSPTESKL